MMMRLHSLWILPALCAWCSGVFAADPDVERAKAQIVAQLVENLPEVDVRNQDSRIAKRNPAGYVHNVLALLNPDGSWSDIDYADMTRGAWKPAQHTNRLVEMARIYADPAGPLHGDATLRAAIHSALGHWLKHQYVASNWWYNDIGTPTAFATFMLLFEKELTPEERTVGLKIVGHANISSTGQNRVWIAGNHLRRGLLREDLAAIQYARDVIVKEVAVAPMVVAPKPPAVPKNTPKPLLPSAEGIQADFTFHQHGPMLQFGNYGLTYAKDMEAWADALRGTRWAFPGKELAILRTYLLEGLRFVCWKQSMDISSCGRQLFRGSPAGKCLVLVNTLERMKRVDPDHAADYQLAIESSQGNAPVNSFVANKHFWRSDYMVDRRSGYYASVKMSSSRVEGYEACNGENQRGYHTSDGVLFLHTRGGEYTDIFPVWDWRKLPGITAAQITGALPLSIERNKSAFVGGVSDGHDGAAVMECVHGGVSAKKSWFFFEGRIACLGAGIASSLEVPVVTTLNQCLLRGDVLVRQGGGNPGLLSRRSEIAKLSWVWHDGMGYCFPEPVEATVGPAPQTGAWQEVFTADSAAPVTRDVFSLWLDHGAKPSGASYAYVILPGCTSSQVADYEQQPDVRFLSNTPDLQAVGRGELTMAVFYKAGQFNYAPGKTLAVNQSCLVMLRERGGEPEVTVADPGERAVSIDITLNGQTRAVPLPQGILAGRSTR